MCCCVALKTLYAQCPDRIVLRERILFLRSSTVSKGQQLDELLPFSSRLEKCPLKNDSVRILLLQRIGALYYLVGKYSEAVSYTESAIDILKGSNTTYTDPLFLTTVYNYFQLYYDSLKLVNEKMNAIDSCIHYALLINEINDQTLYNVWQRTAYALEIGDFQRCVNYASIGETLAEKYAMPIDSLEFMQNFFNYRMVALTEMNQLEIADKEIRNKINEYKKLEQEKLCGTFYNQLSAIAIRQQKFDSALFALKNSFRCNQEEGYIIGIKQCLNNIGYFYLNYLNDPQIALRYVRKALKYKTT